jgi:hypothetical protein
MNEVDQLKARVAELASMTEDRNLWRDSEATCDKLYAELDEEHP